jgi:hypothetical protein
MNQTQIITFFVVMTILLAGGFSAIFIDYVGLIARLFRDKPWCAVVKVWNGKGWDPVKGWRVSTDYFGEIFNYKYNGIPYEVRIGNKYPVQYENRARLIYCRTGQLIALPLPGTDQPYDKEGKPLEPQFNEQEIGLQTYGWALVKLNMSIRGKSAGGMLAWILGGIIVVLLIGGVWYYMSHRNDSTTVPAKPPVTQQATPRATPVMSPIP